MLNSQSSLALEDQFSLVTLKSGIKSLRSLKYEETYHPGVGPAFEAKVLHIDQQKLLTRSIEFDPFIIWDVGLGAAGNTLTAIQMLQEQARIHTHSLKKIEIHSFDRNTEALEFALKNASELGYVAGYETEVQELLRQGEVNITSSHSSLHINWRFHLGNFREKMKDLSIPSPHSIFYDPYSSSKNQEMWTLEHFQNLFQRLDATTPFILTNYTRSTSIRVSLLLSGFFIGRGCIIGDKAETTQASNRLSLLDQPLDRDWLKKLRLSTRSAPLRDETTTSLRLSETEFALLEKHPQFSKK